MRPIGAHKIFLQNALRLLRCHFPFRANSFLSGRVVNISIA